MLRIAVLDDETVYIERIRKITEIVMNRKGVRYELWEYTDVNNFLVDLQEKEYFDIYLLDVELPDYSGIEIARKIRSEFSEPTIIYITNHVDYAIQAFEVNAYRYIPKKLLEEKLPLAYEALGISNYMEHQKVYTITTNTSVEKIPYREIYYLKKDGKYVQIIHQRGESKVRKSLLEVVEELAAKQFLIVDRAFVVNMSYVMSLKDQEILLKNGRSVPVSRTRMHQVVQEIVNFGRRS